ncbi:hypothetical protein BHM03_00032158 [Ensete ventricosum]|nr:hypothetical protein BHM03_00032158 [Ensete ventricosum]
MKAQPQSMNQRLDKVQRGLPSVIRTSTKAHDSSSNPFVWCLLLVLDNAMDSPGTQALAVHHLRLILDNAKDSLGTQAYRTLALAVLCFCLVGSTKDSSGTQASTVLDLHLFLNNAKDIPGT